MPCLALLKLNSALQTLPVVISADNSTAKAWLPARIQLNRAVEPYQFSQDDRLHRYAKKMTAQLRRDIRLSAAQMRDGWRFDADSARTGLHVIRQHRTSVACRKEWSEVTSSTFSYGYEIWAKNKRRNDGTIECAMSPYILMRREFWGPMKADADVEDVALTMKLVPVAGGKCCLLQKRWSLPPHHCVR